MIEHFFATIPGIIVGVGAVLSVASIGFLYVIGVIRGKKDNADDRLINILKTTVDELESKVNKQTTDISELTKEVHALKRDNEMLTKLLQGRDDQTQDFYKKGFAAMDTITQSHDILTTMAESIKNTNVAMVKLIELLGKSVDVVGSIATK